MNAQEALNAYRQKKQREKRISQGLPVGINRAEPTFAGEIVRDIARPIARAGSNLVATEELLAGNKEESDRIVKEGLKSEFLGTVKPLTTVKESIGAGLEIASNLPLAGAVSTVGKGVAKAVGKNVVKSTSRTLPKLLSRPVVGTAIEGGVGSAMATAGRGIQDGKDARTIAKESAVSGLVGTGIGAGFGTVGLGASGALRLSRKLKARTGTVPQDIMDEVQGNIGQAWRDFTDEYQPLRNYDTKNLAKGRDVVGIVSREGFVPELEFVNGRYIMNTRQNIDEATQEIGRYADMADEYAKVFNNERISLRELKDISERVLRESPEIVATGNLDKAQGELRRRINGLRSAYQTDYITPEIANQVRKEMNKLTTSFDADAFEQDVADAIADAVREKFDEMFPDEAFRKVNKKIGDLIVARKYLQKADGKKIGGGKMTQMLSRIVGSSIGSSSGVPFVGPVAGALGGDYLAKRSASRGFGSPLTRSIAKNLPKDTSFAEGFLEKTAQARKNVKPPLLLPAPAKDRGYRTSIVTPPTERFRDVPEGYEYTGADTITNNRGVRGMSDTEIRKARANITPKAPEYADEYYETIAQQQKQDIDVPESIKEESYYENLANQEEVLDIPEEITQQEVKGLVEKIDTLTKKVDELSTLGAIRKEQFDMNKAVLRENSNDSSKKGTTNFNLGVYQSALDRGSDFTKGKLGRAVENIGQYLAHQKPDVIGTKIGSDEARDFIDSVVEQGREVKSLKADLKDNKKVIAGLKKQIKEVKREGKKGVVLPTKKVAGNENIQTSVEKDLLSNEARKYKSADEFVRSQEKIGNAGTMFAGQSIFETYPAVYTKNKTIGLNLKTSYDFIGNGYRLVSNNRELKLNSFEKAEGFRNMPKVFQKRGEGIVAFLVKPFDKLGKKEKWELRGAKVTEDGGKTFFMPEEEVLGTGKTKSQLEQIWNEANKGTKRIISEEAYQKAKENMRKAGSQFNSGIPVNQMKDALVIAGYHIENGVRTAVELGEILVREGYQFTTKQVKELFEKSSSSYFFNTEVRKGLDTFKNDTYGYIKAAQEFSDDAKIRSGGQIKSNRNYIKKNKSILLAIDSAKKDNIPVSYSIDEVPFSRAITGYETEISLVPVVYFDTPLGQVSFHAIGLPESNLILADIPKDKISFSGKYGESRDTTRKMTGDIQSVKKAFREDGFQEKQEAFEKRINEENKMLNYIKHIDNIPEEIKKVKQKVDYYSYKPKGKESLFWINRLNRLEQIWNEANKPKLPTYKGEKDLEKTPFLQRMVRKQIENNMLDTKKIVSDTLLGKREDFRFNTEKI